MQNMLRPIVEAAGYLVIGEKDELCADRHDRVSQDREITPDQGGRSFAWLPIRSCRRPGQRLSL
jgi:hypothetical protein